MSVAERSPCKRTAGEELYLVHLRRANSPHHEHDPEEEDDHDYPEPRKRSRSLGEELYTIHLKRSEGIDPDYDVENTDGVKDDGKKDEADEDEDQAKNQETEPSQVSSDAKMGKDVEPGEGTDDKPEDEGGVHLRDGYVLTKKPQ